MKIIDISTLKRELEKNKITEHKYENIELKRDWSREYGEKISMLCNGNIDSESYIVIGVEDNGSWSGHDSTWLKSRLETVSQQLNQLLDPVIALRDLTSHFINEKYIIIITVFNPGIVVKWKGNAWSGKGTTKRKLETYEILELSLKLPGLEDISKFRSNFIPNPELVKEFCNIGCFDIDEKVLERYHLQNTKCGEILFGNTPFRLVHIDKDGEIIKNETRMGLMELLSEKINIEIREYYKEHIQSPDRISDSLLREAIGNTVGHSAYHENNGEIIIELFPNKIIISNLAYNEYISLANKWFSSAHKSPNPFLMETLRSMRKVDELGRGKKKLLAECLINGFHTPSITISDAGRFKRWSLQIDFGIHSERLEQLYKMIQEHYRESSEKSLIAYALVLWRDKPFTEIAKYFDSYESKIAAEILTDNRGPIFFWEERDKLVLHRWVKVLIEEGKVSKGFSAYEESKLFDTCQTIHNKYYNGFITPKEFRELAHLSNSQSDKNLTSRTLKSWVIQNKLKKIKRGIYKFTEKEIVEIDKDTLAYIMKVFNESIQ